MVAITWKHLFSDRCDTHRWETSDRYRTIYGLTYGGCARSRAAVKTELSYRNDTRITFFFAANKNKDNAKVALAPSTS